MATDVMELARELVDLAGPPLHPLYGAHAIRDGDKIARHLLAMQAVVTLAREYEIEHANPVPDYTLRRMIRERLFKALAALDKLKEGR